MLKEFKEFISRGNLIAVAVGILMGVEFGNVISSFTDNIFTPIFAIIGGKPDFSDLLMFEINDAQFRVGAFITTVINFIIVAAAAFAIVKFAAKLKREEEAESGPSEVQLLTEIRDSLKK